MKRLLSLASICVLCAAGPVARADVLLFNPPSPYLLDLSGNSHYTWGIDANWGPAQTAVSASLYLDGIRNLTSKMGTLYVHLLDDAPLGVSAYADGLGGGDQFAGQGLLLTVYVNLPPIAQDLTYDFTPDQVAVLNSYAADGRFALGLDPDGDLREEGVRLRVVTEATPVPEPGTMVLLLAGAVLAAARNRRGD